MPFPAIEKQNSRIMYWNIWSILVQKFLWMDILHASHVTKKYRNRETYTVDPWRWISISPPPPSFPTFNGLFFIASRKASRNSHEGHKVKFRDRVAYEAAIVAFPPIFVRVTVKQEVKFVLLSSNESNLSWACAGKKYGIKMLTIKKYILSFITNVRVDGTCA